MDAPSDASRIFGWLKACGQVLTCVRPQYAADHAPQALMEVCGSGPVRLRALEALSIITGSPNPVFLTVCP